MDFSFKSTARGYILLIVSIGIYEFGRRFRIESGVESSIGLGSNEILCADTSDSDVGDEG